LPGQGGKHRLLGASSSPAAAEEVRLAAQETEVDVQQRLDGVLAGRRGSRHLLRHSKQRRVVAFRHNGQFAFQK